MSSVDLEDQLSIANEEASNDISTVKSDLDIKNSVSNIGGLVGKRVLCIPRAFKVDSLSPTQVSSTLWSSRILSGLRKGEYPMQALSWCPIHHHHQKSQEKLLNQIEARLKSYDDRLSYSEQSQQINRAKQKRVIGINSPNNLNRQSYVMTKNCNYASSMQSNSLSTTGDYQTDSDNLEHDKNQSSQSCEWCSNEFIQDVTTPPKQITSLPWRLGTIRAVSHRDPCDESLELLIEFDLLDWKLREWYPVYRSINRTSSNETRKVVIEYTNSVLKVDDQEHAMTSESCENQAGKEILLDRSDALNGMTSKEKTKQLSIPQPSGSFRELLIERSICCCIRKQAPTGKCKLWPALAFEPVIDELGLFKSGGLKAIEYFDSTLEDSARTNCDIQTAITELKVEFATIMEDMTKSKMPHNSHSTQSKHEDQSYSNSCVTSEESSTKEAVGCHCWSPKIEFVQDSKIYRLDGDESRSNTSKTIEKTSSDTKVELDIVENGEVIQETVNGTNSSSTANLNSFKKFLRLYNRAYTNYSRLNLYPISSGSSPSMTLAAQFAGPMNDLLEAIVSYPGICKLLKDWHLYQDGKNLLTNAYTATLLVGNRVKVYRCSGTTQWYTAVIVYYDEQCNIMTLTDDTVLEKHHEDPKLLDMHLIDERVVQAFIEGDATSIGAKRRRTQRTIATNQLVIANPSKSNPKSVQPRNSSHKRSLWSPLSNPRLGVGSLNLTTKLANQLNGIQSYEGADITKIKLESESNGKLLNLSKNSNKDVRQRGKRAQHPTESYGSDTDYSSSSGTDRGRSSQRLNDFESADQPEVARIKFSQIKRARGRVDPAELALIKRVCFERNLKVVDSAELTPSLTNIKLGQPKVSYVGGKNFLMHRLRIEALDNGMTIEETPGESSNPERNFSCFGGEPVINDEPKTSPVETVKED